MGSVGYKNRLFSTATIFLRLAFAFIVGYAFAGPFGWVLAKIAPSFGMPFWQFLAFALLFAAVFLVLTHATLVYIEADDVVIPPFLDRLTGIAMGLISGVLLGGIILVAWSMAVSFLPFRFVTEEADFKLDMGKIVLQEFGRLQSRIPGTREFDTAHAVEAYRNADKEAIKKAEGANPPKKEEKPAKKGKSKGPAADLEEESSMGSIRKQLQKEQE